MSERKNNETIEVTKSLYRHPDVFEDFIEAARNFPYSRVYSRLLLWLEFFNESFYNHHCVHYHGTIEALFQIWFNNKVLQEQTSFDFDLSKQFYEAFFEYAKGSVFVDSTASKKLLVFSFVFSKYHGMMQQSALHQFIGLDIISAYDTDVIFEKSFVKYESPRYLISNFEELNTEEIQIMMEALQGKNLRSHPIFPKNLTKQEFALLNSLDTSQIKYNNSIILRGAIIVRLTKGSFEERVVLTFLRASGTYMLNPEKYFQDLDYWKQGYSFVVDGMHGAERCSITDCVDFLEHKKYQSEEPFSLKGRTTNSFLRLVAEWHGYVSRLSFDHYRKESWNKSKMLDLSFSCNEIYYQCVELHTGELLYAEGQTLNHCVITYTPQCKAGLCTIWSLRQYSRKTGEFEPILTLEVSDNKIIQARGLNDRLPLEHEYMVVKDWAERLNLKVELIKNE